MEYYPREGGALCCFYVAGEGGAEGGEEAFDVDHEELFAPHEDFVAAVIDGAYYFICSFFRGDASGLSGIHLAMFASVAF